MTNDEKRNAKVTISAISYYGAQRARDCVSLCLTFADEWRDPSVPDLQAYRRALVRSIVDVSCHLFNDPLPETLMYAKAMAGKSSYAVCYTQGIRRSFAANMCDEIKLLFAAEA